MAQQQDDEYHYTIVESLDDLRDVRSEIFHAMKAQGDSAAETCKNIIERAVVRKVNLVRELVSEQHLKNQMTDAAYTDHLRTEAEQWLIDGFADLEVENTDAAESPLHYAAKVGSKTLVEALLTPFKFNVYRMVNISDSKGWTPLFSLLLALDLRHQLSDNASGDEHLAEEKDTDTRKGLLIRFIQAGVSFSHTDNENKTVLHHMRETKGTREVKFVIKALASLFIKHGKMSLRRQSVSLSKMVYQGFHEKLKGKDEDNRTRTNPGYIYKRFLPTYASACADEDPEFNYAKRCRSHIFYADGSAPSFNVYLPLVAQRIIVFVVLDPTKDNAAVGNNYPEWINARTVIELKKFWKEYNPHKNMHDKEGFILHIDDASPKSPPLDRKGMEKKHEEDKEEEPAVDGPILYLQGDEILTQHLSAARKNGMEALRVMAKAIGLSTKEIDFTEEIAAEVDASMDENALFLNKMDHRDVLVSFIMCKEVYADPVELYSSLCAQFETLSQQQNEGYSVSHVLKQFEEIVQNQWVRKYSQEICFYESSSNEPLDVNLGNKVYAIECWGLSPREFRKIEQFTANNIYAQKWQIRNVQMSQPVASKRLLYVKTRKITALYGMLKIIHGDYSLPNIQEEIELFLIHVKIEFLCKNSDDLLDESVSQFGAMHDWHEQNLQEVRSEMHLEYVKNMKNFRERNSKPVLSDLVAKYEMLHKRLESLYDEEQWRQRLMRHHESFELKYNRDLNMQLFSEHCFQRFCRGPHSVGVMYDEEGKQVPQNRYGRWRTYYPDKHHNDGSEQSAVYNQIIKTRSNTASYFLREIVRPALDADCGFEVCACTDELECNILEIIEFAPSLTRWYGKETQPTISMIFSKLLYAASKYNNEKKATKLIEVLIKKGVDVRSMVDRNPLDNVADRRMLRAASLLIRAGATVKVKALETILNALDTQLYYKAKKLKSDEKDEEKHDGDNDFMTNIRNSMRILKKNTNNRKPRISHKKVRLGEVKSIIRKQVLFHGAESGTLSPDILFYMIENSMSSKTDFFDLTETDDYGATALHYAAMNGHHETILILYQAGAWKCLNARDDVIMTKNGRKETVLPPDEIDRIDGDTTASKVKYRRRCIVAQHLNYRGYSPLGLAVQNSHIECVRMLLELGADPFVRDGMSEAPSAHLVDPACPYWLNLDIYLPLSFNMINTYDKGEGNAETSALDVERQRRFVCVLKQHTVRRPSVPVVSIMTNSSQRRSRRSVVDTHFKSQFDQELLVEQKRRHKRRVFLRILRTWYNTVMREGAKKIFNEQFGQLVDLDDGTVQESPQNSSSLTRLPSLRRSNSNTNIPTKKVQASMSSSRLSTDEGRARGPATKAASGRSSIIDQYEDVKHEINALMKRHPDVRSLRHSYGTVHFYMHMMYFLVPTLLIIYICVMVLNTGTGMNYMQQRIQSVLESKASGFHDINEGNGKFDSYYTYMADNLLSKSLPELQLRFHRIGVPQVEQYRMYPQQTLYYGKLHYGRRHNSTFVKNVYSFDSLGPLIKQFPEQFAWTYDTEPWGLPEGNETKKPFQSPSPRLPYSTSISNATGDINYLKKRAFIDKQTYKIVVKFALYSPDIDSYCHVRVMMIRKPGGLLMKQIFYYVFTVESGYVTDFNLINLFGQVCFLVFLMNETLALALIYKQRCLPKCRKFKYEFLRRKRAKKFWMERAQEEAYNEYSKYWSRGRGVSMRSRKEKAYTTPWQQRRKSLSQKSKKSKKIKTTKVIVAKKDKSFMAKKLDRLRDWWAEFLGIVNSTLDQAQLTRLVYVISGMGLIMIYLVFLDRTQVFKKNLKTSANDIYYETLELAMETSQLLRVWVIFFITISCVKLFSQFEMHPVYGKFVLSLKNVFMSKAFIYFMVLCLIMFMAFTIFYHILFGDVVKSFNGLVVSMMTLVRLSITGEHDEDVFMPLQNSPLGYPMSMFLLLFAYVISIIFMMNLFIAIITDEWGNQMKKDLWDTILDEKLSRHVSYNHVGIIYEENLIINLLVRCHRDGPRSTMKKMRLKWCSKDQCTKKQAEKRSFQRRGSGNSTVYQLSNNKRNSLRYHMSFSRE